MKIKTQLRIFLLGVILIPALIFIAYPFYKYITAPEQVLYNGYKQIRNIFCQDLSEEEIALLKSSLNSLPPNIQFVLIKNHKDIILNTIPEFSEKSILDENEVLGLIKESNQIYFYQMATLLDNEESNIFLVSRMLKSERTERPKLIEKMIYTTLIILCLFELFSITLVIQLTRTISKSITFLDKSTQRIASGELDTAIEVPHKNRKANEIMNLAENLDKMRLSLKDETERRSKFIMGISHDLRTPVAVIKGYTEALNDGLFEDPAEAKKSLDIIESKIEQLETMITTLINFVKLNQTEWIQQLKTQSLKPMLQEFASEAITTGGIFKRNVTADIQISEEISVTFDRQLFHRALENLFTNAIRYSKNNDSIEVRAVQNEDNICISIKDSGSGIKATDLKRIFDLFYRGTNSRREEGMGIGLSVVRTIINAHGWNIEVQSEEGRFTEFKITIPLSGSESENL